MLLVGQRIAFTIMCPPKSEIVLNVTFACDDILSPRGSLLDFVEKLIHRFVEDKKRLRVT